jgi:hypothetical protein
MSGELRVFLAGAEFHVRPEMTGDVARAFLRDLLGLPTKVPFRLWRSADDLELQGRAAGEVLRDSDELELVGDWPVVLRGTRPNGARGELALQVTATSGGSRAADR